MIGGKGWGIYRDGNGNTIAEFDQLKARQTFTANDIVRNEVKHQGGMIINSAASMVISNVEETDNGYKCYFDQEQGSKANLFVLDDIALCQLFSPENDTIRFYKRRVVEIAEDYVTLSKTDTNGTDIPQENDTIIHFGNYTNQSRQYVIIRNVVDGGYEQMLTGLNSVNAVGSEYYFAGKRNGTPQWFVGNRQGDYAEWNGETMRIKGKLAIGSDVGGATVVDGGLVTAETISLGSEGATKAGVTGGGESDDDVRFWAGVPYEQRALAPFRVLQNGIMYATEGVFSGFIKAGTTRITNDNYEKYLKYSSLKVYVLDVEKCSRCIIVDVDVIDNILLELPDLQPAEALGGVSEDVIDTKRGFIGTDIVVYNNSSSSSSSIRFKAVDSSGERNEQNQWTIEQNGFIKLSCTIGAKQSTSLNKTIEYIYWKLDMKGTQMANILP
jgi:hypothetical protein